jgi:hypothetical protein
VTHSIGWRWNRVDYHRAEHLERLLGSGLIFVPGRPGLPFIQIKSRCLRPEALTVEPCYPLTECKCFDEHVRRSCVELIWRDNEMEPASGMSLYRFL